MQIKELFAKLSLRLKKRNAAAKDAETRVFDNCTSRQRPIRHSPCEIVGHHVREEAQIDENYQHRHSEVRTKQSRLGRLVKPITNRAKPILYAKSLLSSKISHRRAQRDDRKRSDSIEAEICKEQLAPACSWDSERWKAVEERNVECQPTFVQTRRSEQESEKLLTITRGKELYRYYHRLPCQEEKPTVAKGTVSRLSLLFQESDKDVPSSAEFITRASSALQCKVQNFLPRKEEEIKDDSFDDALSHTPSQGDPPETINENGNSSCAEYAAEYSQDGSKPGYLKNVKSNSEPATHVPLQKLSGLDISLEKDICSANSSVDSVGVSITILSGNDHLVPAGVNKTASEGKQNKSKCERRAARTVTFHESVDSAEKAMTGKRREFENVVTSDTSDTCEDDDDESLWQVSFRSDEDYCTPILEFELKDIGCGLQ